MIQELVQAATQVVTDVAKSPGELGGLAVSIGTLVSVRRRVKRLEHQVKAVLRLLVGQTQRTGLTKEQRAVVDAVLSE